MIKTYLFLAGAVFCEVAGTMLLPVSQNFTKLVPTAALSFFYLCAFYLLTFPVKLFTKITPRTIKNNPKTACQAKVCLKKI